METRRHAIRRPYLSCLITVGIDRNEEVSASVMRPMKAHHKLLLSGLQLATGARPGMSRHKTLGRAQLQGKVL
jgi:hypothetical protein